MKFTKVTSLSIIFVFLIGVSFSFAQNFGTGSISGTVSSEADSLPVAEAWVLAVNPMNFLASKNTQAKTDSTGFYQFDSLSAGQYFLYVSADSFIAEIYDDAAGPLSASPIMLTPGASVTNIDFYLALGGTIFGTVTDSSGASLNNVLVTATPFDQFPQSGMLDSLLSSKYNIAHTDEDGNYKINTLPTGQYRVTAKLDGAVIQFWENTDDYEAATPVDVVAGVTVGYSIDFNFEYTVPNGTIAGNITDSEGNPLSNIWVMAYNPSPADSIFHNFPGFPHLSKTDENGDYEISGLKPGNYFVSATCAEWYNFQTLWYDGQGGTPVYENAVAVEAVNGEVNLGIDFVFEKATSVGTISGTVVSDEDGSPIANAYVEAMRVDTSFFGPTVRPRPAMFGYTNANGSYNLDMVLNGQYVIMVHKNGYTEFYDDVRDISSATYVEVADGADVENINFAIPAVPTTGSILSGTVTDDSTGAPIPNALIAAFPAFDSTQVGHFQGDFTLFDFYATMADSQGNYILGGLPEGDYIVSCWAPKHVVEFFDNKLDPWEADRISLDGSEERAGVDFSLEPGWGFEYLMPEAGTNMGTIAGHVTGENGENINNAYVSIIDRNMEVRASEITGPDGKYSLGGLPSGEYYIIAKRMPYQTEFYGDSMDINNAVKVTVGESNEWIVDNADFQLSTIQSTSDVESQTNDTNVPTDFSLSQNYPNPFNPTTHIQYSLPKACHVSLKIFNLRGELVRTLVNEFQSANQHQVIWNGLNDNGQNVAAGFYIYQIKAENFRQSLRLLLLK